jgi:hypothetical protein
VQLVTTPVMLVVVVTLQTVMNVQQIKTDIMMKIPVFAMMDTLTMVHLIPNVELVIIPV